MKVYIKANDTPTVKRSPCKKYFENHSGLTKEQIKLVDANRVAHQDLSGLYQQAHYVYYA